MQQVVTRLRETGDYHIAAEPCSGAFAMSGVYRQAGFPASMLQASDVCLFSAILGVAFNDGDHAALGVRKWQELIPLEGDPVRDAAILLYEQVVARMAAKPRVDYWMELETDLERRRDAHIDKLAYFVEQLRGRFTPGMDYSIESLWDHMRRLSHEPGAVILLNPPSYGGAYERFFNTHGRIEWDAEPSYDVWVPQRDQHALCEESKDWAATLLVIQLAEHGECVHPEPIYAHDKRRGANDYIWTNQPQRIKELMGLTSRIRKIADYEKLDNPIVPPSYEITADSVIGVRKLRSTESRYYKDLWIHRLDYAQAGMEFAVFVDGYLVGMAGYGHVPLADDEESISLLYAVGAHHDSLRLTRLVKMLCLQRRVLELTMNAWFIATAERVLTKNWTKHPEAKGQRGIMKLLDRKPHSQYGYELTYAAPVGDLSVDETFELWLSKEKKWKESRQTAA
jgi:hypothetical protein